MTTKPMTTEDFLSYMRNHMWWIEGFACATDNASLKNKANSIRSTLNDFETSVGIKEEVAK